MNKCVPGDRVRITGILLVNDLKNDNISKSYIYVTGIEKRKERITTQYSAEEQETFKKFAKEPDTYEKIYQSIAPGIYGNE